MNSFTFTDIFTNIFPFLFMLVFIFFIIVFVYSMVKGLSQMRQKQQFSPPDGGGPNRHEARPALSSE